MGWVRHARLLLGAGLGLALLSGCNAPAAQAPSPSQRIAAIQAPTAADREVIAPIWYRSPRHPFHSDRFAFKSGRFHPIDDGMGPAGDASFFYNGSTFYVAVNAAGVARTVASASAGAESASLAFGTGPLPMATGDTFAFATPDGTATLTVTGLSTGSMRFVGREGQGTGAVRFRYHLAP